jgi:Ca2+-binding RTX toxin-like protein
MNKFLHGMVQRTCGRDTGSPDAGSDVIYAGAGADHVWAGGADLFARSNGRAANDPTTQAWRIAA